jgi:hypothetical protein
MSGNRNFQPVDELQRTRIKVNLTALVDLIKLNDDLLDKLRTANCISPKQRTSIERLSLSRRGKEKLLEIMSRKNLAAFDNFVSCLEETKQHQVVHLLSNNDGKSA